MRGGFTRAPHFQQTKPGTCLPACTRMVLAHLGDHRSENELVKILAGYEFGTPASNIRRLARLGYQVEYGVIQWEDLTHAVMDNLHPIVFVDAQFLPWADFAGFHAVVVNAVEEDRIELLDPASETAPQVLSKNGFLAAWEEFDRRAALISKQ